MTLLRLVLIRHAKSALGPIDVERQLAPRGRRDAEAIGGFLEQAGIALDRVVVSPARRARETWDGAQSGLAAAVEVVVDDRIYDNDATTLFEVVRETPASVQALGLVGHNPSFGELARALDDTEGDDDARQTLDAGYRTGGVAVFAVSGPWAEMRPHSGTLIAFAVPRAGS